LSSNQVKRDASRSLSFGVAFKYLHHPWFTRPHCSKDRALQKRFIAREYGYC